MTTQCGVDIVNSDFSPGVWNWLGLETGFTYDDELEFLKESDDSEVDITADDFEMRILKPDGTPHVTLSVGSGLTIVPDNILQFLVGPFVDPGEYTFKLIWTKASTGSSFPYLEGTIVLE